MDLKKALVKANIKTVTVTPRILDRIKAELSQARMTVTATGEMSWDDLKRGGEFYDEAQELQRVATRTKMFSKVYPFDKYQGPYAQLKNGDKVWLTEEPFQFFLEKTDGEAVKMSEDDLVRYFKSRKKKKPGVRLSKASRVRMRKARMAKVSKATKVRKGK